MVLRFQNCDFNIQYCGHSLKLSMPLHVIVDFNFLTLRLAKLSQQEINRLFQIENFFSHVLGVEEDEVGVYSIHLRESTEEKLNIMTACTTSIIQAMRQENNNNN